MTSYLFYVLHGFFNKDNPIMVMGIVALIQCTLIIYLWKKYKNKNTSEADE